MEFKLSKYIVLSDSFEEKGDNQKKFKIIYSCRKKMGIKIHSGLEELLKKNEFKILPDNVFSMLMHYEIIIPKEEKEELFLLNFKRILYEGSEMNKLHDFNSNLNCTELKNYLIEESFKLNELIQKGEMFDFLDNNDKMSLIYSDQNLINFLPFEEPDITKKYQYYSEFIDKNIGASSYLLPIDDYVKIGKINAENLEHIIDNFKLKLLLKYKINTKND